MRFLSAYSICFALVMVLSASNVQAAVTGRATLQGRSDHSGIKVLFIPQSPTAQRDSIYTDATGNYSLNVQGGLYNVLFELPGFHSIYYEWKATVGIAPTTTLSDISMPVGISKYVAGDVSGTWYSDTTYYVYGDVSVPVAQTLTINKIVKVLFGPGRRLNVNGTIDAQGAPGQWIFFTTGLPDKIVGQWFGVITGRDSKATFKHCVFEYCSTAVSSKSTSLSFTKNDVRYTNDGIGASGTQNKTQIDISENTFDNVGSAISTDYSVKGIVACNTITKVDGNGINAEGIVDIYNNYIDNTGYDDRNSRGIRFNESLYGNVYNNYIKGCGSGIVASVWHDTTNVHYIRNNTILDCKEYGIDVNYCCGNFKVVNNIIVGNKNGVGSRERRVKREVVDNNLVWSSSVSDFVDLTLPAIGMKLTTNANGDSVDAYNNLSQDPLFIDPTFPVLSPQSPCKGAGEGTFSANIGADFSGTCIKLPTSVHSSRHDSEVPFNENLIAVFPNPFSDEITVEFKNGIANPLTIQLTDVVGRVVLTSAMNDASTRISTRELAPGMYVLSVKTRNSSVSQVLIKR